jgi:AcrR family transcriptional regulator
MADDNLRRRWGQVVDAAAQLFHEKGYAATSVQDVADTLGLLKGSLYYYIKTKEDLLFAVVEDAHAASIANLEVVRASGPDCTAELRAFVRAHLGLLIRERVKLSVYLHDFRSLTSEHQHSVSAKRRDYSGYLEELIARGQQDQSFASSLNPHLTMLALLGMLNWTYEWYREGDAASAEQIIESFTAAALRMVGVPVPADTDAG